MTIRLRTLGELTVLVDGRERPELRARPVQLALLLYLAVEREGGRERLLALLWPESDQEHARQALRQTLYALRQELGDDWLESDHDSLRATPALTADAADLLRAMDAGQPRQVADLYGGVFLEGVHLAQSQPFQLWCDRWRARLERLNRRARRGLIDGCVAAGDLDAALVEARRWLELDPLEDEAQHRVLELLFRLGRGEDAVREYEAYRALLAREELEPLEQTRALVAEMRASSGALPPLPPTPPPSGPGAPAPADADGPMATPAGPSGRRPARRSTARVLVAIAPVVALLAVGTAVVLARHRGTPQPVLEPTRVMVLPLTNETGDSTLGDVGLLAAEWFTHAVAHMGRLEAVPSLDVLQMLAAGLSPAAAARQRHAGTLISGRFFRVNDSLELHVEIADLQRGEIWDDLTPVRLAPDRPEAGLRELTDRVAGSLAVRFIPGAPLARPAVLSPPNYPAFRALLDATPFVQRGDWAGALPHLERAASLDTSFYRARLFVASALVNLGRYGQADSVLDALQPSRERFSAYERLVFLTGRAMLRGDRQAELAAVREGARLDPGGTLHYISAGVALSAGRPADALALYANLDPDCPWAPAFLTPWHGWTAAFHLLGRHDRELAEARRARSRHPNALLPLFLELRALAALGRTDELRGKLREASSLAPDYGMDAGWLLFQTAIELRIHGHGAVAAAVLDSALAWYRARSPAERAERSYRSAYAEVLFTAGQLEESATVVAGLRQDRPTNLDALGEEGALAARLGRTAVARRVVKALQSDHRPYTFGKPTYWLAVIAAWSGDEASALRLLRRSFAEGRSRGIVLHEDPYLEPLWHLPDFALAVSDQH